jgi:hypothetical protein
MVYSTPRSAKQGAAEAALYVGCADRFDMVCDSAGQPQIPRYQRSRLIERYDDIIACSRHLRDRHQRPQVSAPLLSPCPRPCSPVTIGHERDRLDIERRGIQSALERCGLTLGPVPATVCHKKYDLSLHSLRPSDCCGVDTGNLAGAPTGSGVFSRSKATSAATAPTPTHSNTLICG